MEQKSHQLSRWVEEFTGDLYAWASHKIANPETARDLVQDTFLAAAEKIGSFHEKSSPKTWLFSILNHKIVDVYRKQAKQKVHHDSRILEDHFDQEGNWKPDKKPLEWFEEEGNLLDNPEFMKTLHKCMDALPPTWNACIQLKYLSEKKGDEVCQELDITPSNYWQMVHRAKIQLRDCMETNWFQQNKS